MMSRMLLVVVLIILVGGIVWLAGRDVTEPLATIETVVAD